MNRRTLLAGFGGLLALSALPALAQDKTYTLTPKHTAGEMVKYKFAMLMNMKMKDKDGKPLQLPGLSENGMEMKMNSTLVQKTKSVNAEGTATLATQVRNGSMEVMGQTQNMPSSETTMEIDKSGKILKMDMPEAAGAGNPLAGMLQFDKLSSTGFTPPGKPIKVGDKWEQDSPNVMKGMDVKVTNEALAVETLNGVETLRIKQRMKGNMNFNMGKDGKPSPDKVEGGMEMKGSLEGESVFNISVADARMVKMTGTFKAEMKMELPKEAAQQSPFGSTMNIGMEGTMSQNLLSIGKISDDAAPVQKSAPTAKPPVKAGKKKG